MEGFTFVAFTYNQENYIIEHLESVKNQIVKYGSQHYNTIIICDDCSSDRTIEFAKKWYILNKALVCEFRIIKQERNVGIVQNYLTALQSIKTNLFSILAGDDLYYDNNVYSACEQTNFVYTPRISFDSQGNIHKERLWLFKKCLITKKPLKNILMDMMSYKMVIDVMSVKWRKELCSASFYKEVSRYTWVEDYPSMINILNNPKCNISLNCKPIILYRDDTGISKKNNHNKKSEYDIDQIKMFKDYNLKVKIYPKYLNIYNYVFELIKVFDFFRFMINRDIKNFEYEYSMECLDAKEYLKKLRRDADALKKQFTE